MNRLILAFSLLLSACHSHQRPRPTEAHHGVGMISVASANGGYVEWVGK